MKQPLQAAAILSVALGVALAVPVLRESTSPTSGANASQIEAVDGNGFTGYFPDQFDISKVPYVDEHIDTF